MNATTTADDGGLKARLAAHHRTFGPVYGGYLSDHGPMAALAYRGLGASPDLALAYLEHYQQSLEPLADADRDYLDDLKALEHACLTEGVEAVLARELPGLVSGWARDAYHPIIRIGYGFEFGIPEEVAAGLAYLKRCGPDRTIEALARQTHQGPPESAFESMKACASSVTPERNFTEALARVVQHPGFRQAALSGPHVLRDVSRLALSAFAGTGNFFALHLVTGSHAYRLLYPFAGEHRDPIFAMGVLGGFAAIEAPSFQTLSEENKSMDAAQFKPLLSRRWPDEHDVKIAYSSMRQAEFFADPAFTTVAVRYLESRGAV